MGCCVIFCAAEFDALARPLEKDDYILAADGGTESEYELWIEEESIVWRVPDGGAAHLSPASPEALREYLDGVQE